MASALPPILVEIQADVASLKKGLADAQNALKGIDNSVEQTGSSMTKFMDRIKQVGATLGIAFAGTQIISFFRESIAAANEASNAQERLATLLRNTNGGTEAQIQALIQQAEALEAVGVVSKDNIIVAQSQLATFDLTAKTINTLTPAILDYVTAEKGAAASADDYRQMTNSLAQALNGNFASLTRVGFVLDETTKKQISSGTESERAAAIVEVLNSTYKGFNETLRDNNPLQAAINDLDKLKGDIGEALLPIIDELSRFISNVLIPGLRSLAKFVKENADAIKAFAGVIAVAYAGMKLYRGILLLTATAQKAYQVATVLMRGGQLATIASTNTLAASMLRLNAIMRANPFGLIVTAVALVAAALVTAWKKSETFRNVVISVAKAALNAFASIIPMVARVYEVIAKVVTGPLRLLLTAVSKIPGVGKYAKSGLDLINKGLEGISDLGDKAAAKAKDLSAKLDQMGKSAKDAGKKVKEATDPFAGSDKGGGGKGKTLTDKEKEKLAGYQKKVKDIYEDMNNVINEAGEKAQAALETRNERMMEAHERYNETVAELRERYAERIADAEERFAEKVADSHERYDEQMYSATVRHKEQVAQITKRFNSEIIDITKKHDEKVANLKDKALKEIAKAQEKHDETVVKITKEYKEKIEDIEQKHIDTVADLRAKAEEKAAEVTAKGQAKLLEIIEKGRERLRSAWQSGTAFSIKDLFGQDVKTQGASELLDNLREQMALTKTLQERAGELSGKGYTQTFIEQIVKAGPAAGTEMANALLELDEATQTEIQELYMSLETLNTDGMNQLATSMNDSMSFATAELADMYYNTQQEIAASLTNINNDLETNIAQSKTQYLASLTEAARVRDEKLAETAKELKENIAETNKELQEGLAEANKDMVEAIAEAKTKFNEALADSAADLAKAQAEAKTNLDKSLADAQKALVKAREEAKKDLDKGLADAQKTLQDSLIAAQKAYEKAIDEINAATDKKLEELKKKLAEVAALMAQLSAAQARAAVASAPVYTPVVAAGSSAGGSTSSTGTTSSTTVNVTGVNLTSPTDTANSVINAIKFGNVVVPTAPTALAAKESGAIGAASIAARTVTVAPKIGGAGGGGAYRGSVAL